MIFNFNILQIVVYQPNKGRGVPLGDSPPALPEKGADAIYNYENIPEKLWKKYSYAARFINLLKSKTTKITFYSASAKCCYMENGPNGDFEMSFYEGTY